MKLSREIIQRMIADRVGSGSSSDYSGGGGGGVGIGFIEENYISKAFFNSVFAVKGTKTTQVGDAAATVEEYTFAPNEVPTSSETTDEGVTTIVTTAITNIEAKGGLWTNSFISALGAGSSGGGTTLNEPLSSINAAGLDDHPSGSGQTIVWNGSTWVYGSAGGGGGGASYLTELSDVNSNMSPSNNQVLYYNNILGKWTNGGDISQWDYAYDWVVNNNGNVITNDNCDVLTAETLAPIDNGGTDLGYSDYRFGYVYGQNGDFSNSLKIGGADVATQTWVTSQGYLTGVAFADLPTMYWANVPVSNTSSTTTSPKFGSIDFPIGGQIEGVSGIKMNHYGNLSGYGGYIDFHFVDSNHPYDSSVDYTTRIIERATGSLTIESLGSSTPCSLIIGKGVGGDSIQIGSISIVYDASNNALKVIKSDGTAGNIYATGFVSALGAGSSGGGGGSTTLGGLLDVNLSSPQNGEALVYRNGYWVNETIQAGGGTVTSVGLSMPTGFSITGSPITSSGTLAVSFGGTVTKNYVLASPSSNNGAPAWRALVAADIPDLSGTYLTSSAISDMATQTWVTNQGYQTANNVYSALTSFAYISSGVVHIGDSSITPWTSNNHPTTIAGYSISDAKFGNQGTRYIPITLGNTTKNVLTGVDFSDVTGTIAFGQLPDLYWANILVSNSSYSNKTPNFSAIELNTTGSISDYGGYIDFHYGGGDNDYTTRLAEHGAAGVLQLRAKNTSGSNILAGLEIGGNVTGESYLQIGYIRLVYDNANNALKVIKNNGTSANLYATGSLSSLGLGSANGGGDGNVDNLYVNNSNNVITGDTNRMIINGKYNSANPTGVYFNVSEYSSHPARFWESRPGPTTCFSCLDINRIYFTSNVFIFYESTNLKININGTTYTLTKTSS